MTRPSTHYTGDAGKSYFAYQNQGGLQRGRINARKFAPYVTAEHAVLDFGCGSGTLLYHLPARQKVGVEINPAAREAATQLGIDVHASLAELPDHAFDRVISNHALEHVRDPYTILLELFNKLISGGQIILFLPLDDWRTQRVAQPNDINRHLYTWTPLLLGNLLMEAGFRVDQARVYTHAWPPSNWQMLDQRLPVRLFDLLCYFTAIRYRRRQVMAVAHRP